MFSKYADLIIRPPRSVASKEELGPVSEAGRYERSEFRIPNSFGKLLFGSLIRPANTPTAKAPLFVYAHANASNRTRALEFRDIVISLVRRTVVVAEFSVVKKD